MLDMLAFSRRLYPWREDLSTEAAQAVLPPRLDCKDADRFQELLTKQQDETLIPGERDELGSYLRAHAFFRRFESSPPSLRRAF